MKLTKIKGWGKAKVEELAKFDISSVEEIMVIPPPQYAEMIGVDNDTAFSHNRLAIEAYNIEHKITSKFKKANEYDDEEVIERIKTGSKALDKLFLGGIETKATTEIYGEFGCGKTQFAHTMAVLVKKPIEEGGLNGKVVWISTENTFEKKRIKEIALANDMDVDEVLDNITVAEAYNSVDQYDILLLVEKMLVDDPTIKLLVVDSATGLFRQDFSGLGHLSERQKYLDRFLSLCSNMAKLHHVAVIWTNQIYQAPTFFGDGITAVGGSKIAHKSTYRVYFSKSGKYRIAKMVDSPKDAQTEVMFGLSSRGCVDMDVAKAEEDARKKEVTRMKAEGKKGNVVSLETNESLIVEDGKVYEVAPKEESNEEFASLKH